MTKIAWIQDSSDIKISSKELDVLISGAVVAVWYINEGSDWEWTLVTFCKIDTVIANFWNLDINRTEIIKWKIMLYLVKW